MKKNLFLSLFLLYVLTLNAQTTSFAGWNTITLSYDVPKIKVEGVGSETFDYGLSLDYARAVSIANTAPLFVEGGVGLSYFTEESINSYSATDITGSDTYLDYEVAVSVKTSFVSMNIPVKFAYEFKLNDEFSLIPYAGLYAKIYMLGQIDMEFDGEKQSVNLFSDNDMGLLEAETAKRFNYGYLCGAKLKINHFLMGVGYSCDMSEIFNNTKMKSVNIYLGCIF